MKISEDKERAVSFELANDLLRYDSVAGLLYWKRSRYRVRAGDDAGSIATTTGYRIVKINYQTYLAHRVAWLLHYGRWPRQSLDHINTDKLDNRIENLREATNAQNGANRKASSGRSAGTLKGTSFQVRKGRRPVWRATIRMGGKTKNLGNYQSEMEAHQAYCAAATAAFGAFARTA